MSIVNPPRTGNASPLPPPPKHRKAGLIRRPRTWRGWLAVVGVVTLCLLLVAWGLARSTPSWYQPLDPHESWVIDAAGVAEIRIVADLHTKAERTPFGDQRWSISEDELNSWLAVRFADPLNPVGNRIPDDSKGFSGPTVVFTPGKVTVAVRSPKLPGANPRGGVGSAVFTVEQFNGPDGEPLGRVRLDGLWVGCLPVPKSLIASQIREAVPKITEAIVQSLGVNDAENYARIAEAVGSGESFSLKFIYRRRVILIKQMWAGDGEFTIVLSPPTPTAVRPRPVN